MIDPLVVKNYNKGAVFGDWTLENSSQSQEHSAQLVASSLRSMKHSVYINSPDYRRELLSEMINQSTALYISSHGSTFPFLQWGMPGTIDPDRLYWDEARDMADSPEKPRYNFVFLDACLTSRYDADSSTFASHVGSRNWSFAKAFLGEFVSYDNRAEMGYTDISSSYWASTVNQAFWSSMAAGNTVIEARDAAMIALFQSPWLNSNGHSYTSRDPEDYLVICGDPFTRLWNVYTGNRTQSPYVWYLPL